MFENLTNRLSSTLRKIRGYGRITENNINDTLREVRIALLEADVALPIVKDFINSVKKHAMGHAVSKSLTPGQEFIKIVKQELITAMGNKDNQINLSTSPPAVILLVGLQGTGKTTSIIKIAKLLRDQYKKKILTVSADIYRPAALIQLQILANQIGIDCYPSALIDNHQNLNPVDIVSKALKQAQLNFYDVLLVDTAGRLHIDIKMMDEIKKIHRITNPVETIFVVDAMTGQDAINSARVFNEMLSITGIMLTKLDGDARGGATLSIRHMTGKPIKFIGLGEKIEAIEPFDPERMACRILGMSDVISIIEKIETNIDHYQSQKMVQKLNQGNAFDLNDFLVHIKQIRKMDVNEITTMIGRLSPKSISSNHNISNQTLIHMEAIINSMTREERKRPEIIKGSRKRRIAKGSGLQVQEVNNLLKQFGNMQRLMKQIKPWGISKWMSKFIKI
ncbi:MAG: signal recognition particle protein [Candidatus Dasytiphilus stammeri]